MLWERIYVKPLIIILFFNVFDKIGTFAVLMIYCATPVPANQQILTQKQDPLHFKFSAELKKLTPSF